MSIPTSCCGRCNRIIHSTWPAKAALKALPQQDYNLCIVPQNLVELLVLATRPPEQNGLGYTIAEVRSELTRIRAMFTLLPETPDLHPAWERLVIEHQVSGKKAHDARLVAAMQVHEISAILTFDKDGFSRYPEIEVIHPEVVTEGEDDEGDVD